MVWTKYLLPFLFLLSSGLAAAQCGSAFTPISEIQGNTDASPLAGQTVVTEGVLTLDSRMTGGFGGFYLQSPDDETDDDPKTSEGLFIYTRKKGGRAGDRIRIQGEVKEYHGLTELVEIRSLSICGKGVLPDPTPLPPQFFHPNDAADPMQSIFAFEAIESMLIDTSRPLKIADQYGLARFGELTLVPETQVMPTEHLAPGTLAFQRFQQQNHQQIRLDDNRNERYPDPVPWPRISSAEQHGTDRATLRVGDTVSPIRAILDFRYGAWRLQPVSPVVFSFSEPRPAAPSRQTDDSLRIVTFNLGNAFNGNGKGRGFNSGRGAETLAEWRQQRQRLTAAIQALNADIVALTELENDDYGEFSALAELTRSLGPEWSYVRTPGEAGDDAIRTDLVYRTGRVTPIGLPQRIRLGAYQGGGRPPVVQTFRFQSQTFRLIAVHFKSKRCERAEDANRDRKDGQGCFTGRRNHEASTVLQFLKEQDEQPAIIAGDFNSYTMEAPMARFQHAGFVNLLHAFHPCTPNECPMASYRYRGRAGNLDHILASADLARNVLAAQTWNINAEEPSSAAADGPWRSSDHNPIVIDLSF